MKNVIQFPTTDNSSATERIENLLHVIKERVQNFNGSESELSIIKTEVNQLSSICGSLKATKKDSKAS